MGDAFHLPMNLIFRRAAPTALIFIVVLVVVTSGVSLEPAFSQPDQRGRAKPVRPDADDRALQSAGRGRQGHGAGGDGRESAEGARPLRQTRPGRLAGRMRADVRNPKVEIRGRSNAVPPSERGVVSALARAHPAWRRPEQIPADGRRREHGPRGAQRPGRSREPARRFSASCRWSIRRADTRDPSTWAWISIRSSTG